MADFNFQSLQGESYDPESATVPYEQNNYDDASEEDDDYDPSNLHFASMTEASQAHLQTSTDETVDSTITTASGQTLEAHSAEPVQAAQKNTQPKQRTVGGFVVDDEDDDEEDTLMENNGQAVVAAEESAMGMQHQRSVTQTPVNTTSLPAPDTSIDKEAAQDQGSSGVTVPSTNNNSASNGVASAQVSSNAGVTPSQTSIVPNAAASTSTVPLPKARLPQDRIGILEDRIAEDPRGDTDAWLSLIEEYKQRNKIQEVYETYDRFLTIFPQAGDQWAAYVSTMMRHEDTNRAAQVFQKILLKVPHVRCWQLYLDYIRRMNNLAADNTGNARTTINSAFEFTVKQIGNDPSSGPIWQDYINFIKSGPGNISGDGWQDKQKVDLVRKVYRQALAIPLPGTVQIWGEYTTFEVTASRMNGRKFLNEQMPAYMTAKQAYIALENKIQYLNRSTVPRFPPLPGCEGHEAYQHQVKIWRDWIQWEKDDPLVLKDDKAGPEPYKNRILYVYKLALMSLRFEPQFWYDAAQFCFDNDMKDEGEKFLTQGMDANPESCLLTFTKADRVETETAQVSDLAERGQTVRQPYNKLLDALYDLIKKTKARTDKEIAQIQERYAREAQQEEQREGSEGSEENDMDGDEVQAKEVAERHQTEIKYIQDRSSGRIHALKRLNTSAWVALIRAMRRVQGKGKPGTEIPGSRGVLTETRKRGQVTSDLYIQCALTEWYCYKDPAALRLFDKGMTLYPNDENFALEYIKHLINQLDYTNARTVFEKVVSRLEKDPETRPKTKPLYYHFHTFESKYGELAQIQKLEQRMRDLFPEDPMLHIFAHRFEYQNAFQQRFDPTTFQPIISPNTQTREPTHAIPSIENAPPEPGYLNVNSPRIPPVTMGNNSPKRPFDGLDGGPPRKLQRGESPLKGAAGRRVLDASRRRETPLQASAPTGWVIPRDVNFLLSVLPNSRFASSLAPSLDPVALINVLRTINLQPHLWPSANLKAAGPGLLHPQYAQPPPAQQGPPPSRQGPPAPSMSMPPTPTYHQAPPPPMGSLPPQQAYYAPPPLNAGPPPQYGFMQGPPVVNGIRAERGTGINGDLDVSWRTTEGEVVMQTFGGN